MITSEDVRRIKRYVKIGLELPTDLEQVRQLLGGQDSDIEGPKAAQALRDKDDLITEKRNYERRIEQFKRVLMTW